MQQVVQLLPQRRMIGPRLCILSRSAGDRQGYARDDKRKTAGDRHSACGQHEISLPSGLSREPVIHVGTETGNQKIAPALKNRREQPNHAYGDPKKNFDQRGEEFEHVRPCALASGGGH